MKRTNCRVPVGRGIGWNGCSTSSAGSTLAHGNCRNPNTIRACGSAREINETSGKATADDEVGRDADRAADGQRAVTPDQSTSTPLFCGDASSRVSLLIFSSSLCFPLGFAATPPRDRSLCSASSSVSVFPRSLSHPIRPSPRSHP